MMLTYRPVRKHNTHTHAHTRMHTHTHTHMSVAQGFAFVEIVAPKFLISRELFQKVAMEVAVFFRCFFAMKLREQVQVVIKSCEFPSL